MSKKPQRKYRRTPVKVAGKPAAKPIGRTTKIILIICAAVLALAGIWYFVIFDDGSLPVKDGMVQISENNWVIVNHGTTGKPKYYKLAQVKPFPGFTRNTDETYKTDKNTTDIFLVPDDPQSMVKYCYITGIPKSSEEAVSSAIDNFSKQYGKDGISDKSLGPIGRYQAAYFIIENTSANETGKMQYSQQLNCYLPYDKDNCILLNVTVTTDEPGKFLSDSQLLQIADSAAEGILLSD